MKPKNDTEQNFGSKRLMTLRNLDLTLLLAFEILMEERHVTRAAVRLGVTQSALSGMLARLRQLLQDDLFIRSSAGMQPTPFAIELLGPVQQALDLLQSHVSRSMSFSPSDTHVFRIGMSDYASSLLLPPLIKRMRAEFPAITLQITIVSPQAAVPLLDKGSLDLMIGPMTDSSSRLIYKELITDTFSTIMSPQHKAAQEDLDLERFLAVAHMVVLPDGFAVSGMSHLEQTLKDLDDRHGVKVVLTHFMQGFWLLDDTDLAFTLPTRLARLAARRYGFVIRKPPVRLQSFAIKMCWHPRCDKLPSNIWLRQFIEEVTMAFDNAPDTAAVAKSERLLG